MALHPRAVPKRLSVVAFTRSAPESPLVAKVITIFFPPFGNQLKIPGHI